MAKGNSPAAATPAATPKPVSVLFVCLGNICRSTMSEGVFTSLASTNPLISTIDSCGTGAYHIGHAPDHRTMSTLRQNGITSYKHTARQFEPDVDFAKFEYILAMDRENLEDLVELRKREVRKRGGEEGVGKVMLFGEFGGEKGEEVEDPYYGGKEGFKVAYEQAVRFSEGFLEKLGGGELS